MNEDISLQVDQVLQGAQGVEVPIVGKGNEVLVVLPEKNNGENREASLT